MPEVTKREVSALKEDVKTCNNKISALQSRISTLVDENRLLEKRISKMSSLIAEDIKFLYDKIN